MTCPQRCSKPLGVTICALSRRHRTDPMRARSTSPRVLSRRLTGAHGSAVLTRRSQGELNQLEVQAAIARWQRTARDTGSGEVQVAVFTQRIKQLSEHLARHPKDSHTKRRLTILVSQRQRMLRYMRLKQRDRYLAVIAGLGIRATKQFDPTMSSHTMESTSTWAAKGLNKCAECH